MKIWVVCGGFDYEGYDIPVGIFSSKEKADEIANKCKGYDLVTVVDFELDVPNEYRMSDE